MKKIISLALLSTGIWAYYANFGIALPVSENKNDNQGKQSQEQYKCDGRQYCSQMKSYEEAKYFLDNCPNTKMDGDGDGIPCERQFGR